MSRAGDRAILSRAMSTATEGAHDHATTRVRAASVAGALALVLAACGATLPEPFLHNIAQVQTAIEQTVLAREHLDGTTVCPSEVPAIAHQVFSCVVAIPAHAPQVFAVTVVEPTGGVSYVRTQ